MGSTAVKYSYVVPVYFEQDVLPLFFERMGRVLDMLDGPAEVIMVDDGSRDQSYAMMSAQALKDPRYKVLQLSRNFGHQIAVTAGLDFASGQATIVLDADLQDPPEFTLKMIELWQKGYEVVYGVRIKRHGDTYLMTKTREFFYRMLNRMSDIELPADAGDFRLIDWKVRECLAGMREHNRYIRGLVSWSGFNQISLEYERPDRAAGESKYPIAKLIKLASDGILSFSTVPLHLALIGGLLISALSFFVGLFVLIAKLMDPSIVAGWTSLVIFVSLLSGMILFVLGVTGLYIGRIYEEVKDRPIYILKNAVGISRGRSPRRMMFPGTLRDESHE